MTVVAEEPIKKTRRRQKPISQQRREYLLKANQKSADVRRELVRRHVLEIGPKIRKLVSQGMTLDHAAQKLNETGIPTRCNGKWCASTVWVALQRLKEYETSKLSKTSAGSAIAKPVAVAES
jgi:hypothetical protein